MNITKSVQHFLAAKLSPKSWLTFRSHYMASEISKELSFTSNFYDALSRKLQAKQPGYFLRLEVTAGQGCEGFTYKFRFENSPPSEKDLVKTQTIINKEGKQQQRILFAINEQEIRLLNGATVDYADEMMREIFYVKENPNAEIECSCKVSFSPKQGLL